jgi:uncharacterized protein YfiM (DUF2279 family)
MNLRHILLLGVIVLTLGLALVGQASARPLTKSPIVAQTSTTPDLIQRWIQRQTPTAPDLIERWVQRQPAASFYTPAALKAEGLRMNAMARAYGQQSTTAPDLVERWVGRQPAASFYTPAALKAEGLRMQALARAYERQSTNSGTSSFDTRDALIGAAGGLGVAICAAGLLIAVVRSRRPQIAL